MPYAFLAVGCGAFFGACLRYALSLVLNPVFPTLPFGTLAANLLGGLVMGLTIGASSHFQALPPEARVFLTTGFLGGLTTFSTFSAETVTLLMRQEYIWTFAIIFLHLMGSLTMTVVGFASAHVIWRV